MDKELLDLTDSKLPLDGDKKLQDMWSKTIDEKENDLKPDRSERGIIYKKRKDFYTGEQGDYSNIFGVIKDTKQKKGHTNQVTNYAGKTVVKIAFGMANNPPQYTVTPDDDISDLEKVRAQAVEKYTDSVFKKNKFWKSTYRTSCFMQSEYGDAAIKVYPQDKAIKICGHNNMETLMVLWNGNHGEYDGVLAEVLMTPKSIYDTYGIKVNAKVLESLQKSDPSKGTGNWQNNGQWDTKNRSGDPQLPSGKNKLRKLRVLEFDSKDVYAIKIEGELVELVLKDDINFPKVMFWTIIPNIPNPPSPWSIADIDFLMDPQIELNDNDNRSSDHLRIGNVQRYVAYNMTDFDPESIKTSSGQVIFVNDPDGKSKFEPLQTNINNFPDDQYNQRKMNQMYDMGLPKVTYGASGADSGRSKAIDYQSSIDLTTFKRDAWELALQEVCEKIQIFGNFLNPDQDWFLNEPGEFITRNVEFDWEDILPTSQSDKIVNIANKVNMIGLSMRTALKELGYRNPDAEIAQLKKELADPDLMILRSKMWQLSSGLLQAQNAASVMQQSNAAPMDQTAQPNPNQSSATLTPEQNSGASPMAAAGTTSSSAAGAVGKAMQNNLAGGR